MKTEKTTKTKTAAKKTEAKTKTKAEATTKAATRQKSPAKTAAVAQGNPTRQPARKAKTAGMKTRKGKKVYPLTAAQKLHFFSQLYCPKKQLLNIGTSLTIEQELDFGALKESIYEAYDRCESMRLRFAADKEGNAYQYVVDKETRDIEHFDFTGWSEEDTKAKLVEWTSTPFEPYDSPMNRVVMVVMPDGFRGIYLLVHHMTMDAQSLILFFRDVIELYCNRMYEGVPYPADMSSYLEQLEKDLAYEAGSQAQRRNRDFFEKLIGDSEPVFADVDGAEKLRSQQEETGNPNLRAVDNRFDNVDANILSFQLEEEPSARLMKFCEDNQVSMVCLLMMGLRTYLQKENGLDDVSIVTTVARRATLKEKRSGGTRIHCFPFRTVIPGETTFLEALRQIRDGQNAIFRHANYDPVEYFATRSRVYGLENGRTYEPMSLTYQPMTLKEKGLDKLVDIRYKSSWYTNGVAAQALYLTVTHRADDNGLSFNWEYQTGAATPEKLEYIHYYLCRILFHGVENGERTVNEIISWA